MSAYPVAHYVVAGLCVVCATVLAALEVSTPMIMTLTVAGVGVLAKAAHEKSREASRAEAKAEFEKERANAEKNRADELFEQTQTLRRGK